MDEEIRIMKSEMAKNDWNVYTQVFQETDLVQHMFWRYIEPKNPRYEDNPIYKNAIRTVYERMDQVIGDVQKSLPKDTTLIVMSDHGFAPYNYSVDLNAWLVDNGYMTLKDPSKRGDWMNMNVQDPKFWDNVDWSKTKAYGLGLGSLYINLKGREGQGIVTDAEYPALRNEIRDGLLSLKNGDEKVFSNIYKREDVMHGQYLGDAADLIMGFAKGYRVSWQTTYGAVPKQVIFPNDSKFSAEHCSVDPVLVPGMFISNTKYGNEKKSILDIAPTVLDMFGITAPADMDGKVIN
jgi:predicted AlkP superfamily phosphohydrolase/phosphomutase